MVDFCFVHHPSPACPSCHAASIVETAEGELLTAWFGGTHEGHPDVAIWLAHCEGGRWGEPRIVADEPDVPLWNPVLYRDRQGTIWLFYKVAPYIPAWTGAYIRSHDGGETWSRPAILPAGLLGPAKNKPITLSNHDIVCGTSSESWRSWSCWVEISCDGGRSWSKHGPIAAPGHGGEGLDSVISASWDPASQALALPQGFPGVIQPTVWEHAPGRLKMLMRATQAVGSVCVATSEDCGRTWSPARPTAVPNPNSGLDAVHLGDGRVVLACNPVREGRSPLSLLMSEDDGETWPRRLDLESGSGEYSYPSIIRAASGELHVVYTYQRTHIRHATVRVEELAPGQPNARTG